MTRTILAAALILLIFPTVSDANLIGLFGEAAGTTCSKNFPLYATTDVRVVAHLTTVAAVTAAEFRIDGVGSLAGVAIMSPAWNTNLVIGNAFTPGGIALAFNPPLEPAEGQSTVFLGNLPFFVISAGWPVADTIWCVAPTIPDEGAGDPKLVLVNGSFVEVPADGWCFKANCTTGCDCLTIPVEDTSWSEIKALY